MIKRILILNLLLSLSLLGISQTPNWQWIKGGGNGSKSLDYSFTDLGSDNEGNIYGVCRYNGYVQFDTLQWMMGYGGVDFCVVSYTCEGQFRWVKRFGGQGNDFAAGITVMKNGDCIVSGSVGWCNWGDAYFADSMLTANNSICRESFICKLNKNGNIVYLNFPSKQYELAWVSMLNQELGPDGMIHILTTFMDSTTWGNFHIQAKGNYMLKLDPNNGQMVGFTRLDFMPVLYSTDDSDIKIDKTGDYYINIPNIGDTIFIANDTILTNPSPDYFYVYTLAKFNSQGNNIWYKEFSWEEPYPYDTAIFGLSRNFAMDEKKIYLGGVKKSKQGTHFMGFPINNPIASSQDNFTSFVAAFDKDSGNIVNFINLWSREYITVKDFREVKNGKLYDGGQGGLVVLNNGTDTVNPMPDLSHLSNEGYIPFIYEIDTGLTHFNWSTGLYSVMNSSFYGSSIHIDHNDNIFLGTKLSGGFMLPQDTTLGQYTGAYIMKIAPTNDSCDCEASIPSVAIMGSSGNTLTISGSATNSPDSLYVFWGDGDSSLYANPGTHISHTYSNQGPWDVCLRSYAFCGDRDTCLSGIYLGMEIILEKGSFFSVYPNPAKDKVVILFSEVPTEPIEIQLFDIMGKMIMNQFVLSQKQSMLDLSNLNKGVYILKIKKSGWSKAVKIVNE
jgi:hypothetical protein